MRIAIIQNTIADIEKLANIIINISSLKGIYMIYKSFMTPKEYLQNSSNDEYDAFFIDINSKETINGIDLAKLIRQKDLNVPIVFVTSESSFAIDGYKVHALDYLLKPAKYEEVEEVVNLICDKKNLKQFINLRIQREYKKIEIHSIMYISSYNHRLELYLDNGSILVSYINFSTLWQLLKDKPQFQMCNRGIIVNFDYIDTVEKDKLILSNKNSLPISRSKQNEISLMYNKYMYNKMKE